MFKKIVNGLLISLFSLVLITTPKLSSAAATCAGKFINPITDVCWSCMFPMYISPLPVFWNIKQQKGQVVLDQPSIKAHASAIFSPDGYITPLGICGCPNRLYMPGILMSFYEPYRSVDITKAPFCFVGLGGLDLGEGLSSLVPAPNGAQPNYDNQGHSSFMNMHWYLDPILAILEILDTGCTMGDTASIDIAFMSEIDPMWNDDDVSFIFAPDSVLYTSLPAQLACTVDCIATSIPNVSPSSKTQFINNVSIPTYGASASGMDNPANMANPASNLNPSKYLYWCAGCQGSIYPLDGNNANNIQQVQNAILSAVKANNMIHRLGLQMKTTGFYGMCANVIPDLQLDKAEWKYQMQYPLPQGLNPTTAVGTCCNAIGETDSTWNSGASFPITGEDFNFLWFHERDCCYF
jgi:conjugal transfer pilus assembly protein TraU